MDAQRRHISHRRRILSIPYTQQVLATGPIAYWPLDEVTGTTVNCLVNPSQSVTPSGITWAQDNSGPFCTPAPFFDGINDLVNLYTAALDAAFNGATGSFMVWAKVYNADVWDDETLRYLYHLNDDAENHYEAYKGSALGGQVTLRGEAGNGLASDSITPITDTDWIQLVCTWSDEANADEFIAYKNGLALGAPKTALGTWAGGGLSAGQTCLGDRRDPTAQPWHGYLAHAVIWDHVIPAALVNALSSP